MSKGIGRTQREVLALLDAEQGRTTADLATATGRSQPQILTTVRTLEKRGLVLIETNRVIGWDWSRGRWAFTREAWESWTDKPKFGMYRWSSEPPGTPVTRWGYPIPPEAERMHLREGEPLPRHLWTDGSTNAWGDMTLYRFGMPVVGNLVWLASTTSP